MAQTSYPFSGQSVTETQYRALARTYAPDMIRTGLACTPSTSAPSITVGAGMATVDGCAYVLDAATKLTVSPASASYARRIWVYLRMDTSGDTRISVHAKAVAGTGTPPWTRDPSGVWEMPLGYATIPANRASFESTSFVYVASRQANAGAGARSRRDAEHPATVGRGATLRGLLTGRAQYGPSGLVIWTVDMDLWMGGTNNACDIYIDCDGGQGSAVVTRAHTLNHGPLMMHAHGIRVAQGKPGATCTATVKIYNEATSSGSATLSEPTLTPISL